MNVEELIFTDNLGTYMFKKVNGLLAQHNVYHLTKINVNYYEKIYKY